MPGCVVFGCKNTTGYCNKRFFQLPKVKSQTTKLQQEKWLRNIQLSYGESAFQISKKSYVCEDHFHENCFARDLKSELLNVPTKKKLREGVIPTIFSNNVFREINIDGTIVEISPQKRPYESSTESEVCS